jgi:uncharacterized phage-associated protein
MEGKMYSANEIASWLLAYAECTDSSLTRKSLQKLLYFSQAHYLEQYGVPLFYQDIEAWEHGPVVREVWERTKRAADEENSYEVYLEEDATFDFNSYKDINNFMGKVWNTYGIMPALRLERKTHKELPWIWKWEDQNDKKKIISPALLRGYYEVRTMVKREESLV